MSPGGILRLWEREHEGGQKKSLFTKDENKKEGEF